MTVQGLVKEQQPGGMSHRGAGMHWKGGSPPQGAQPMPSHCLPGGKCQIQQHL